MNPVVAQCPPQVFLENVLEPAFAFAHDSTLRPRLVRGATYTKTPPFTVTFRIHSDARWSDRVPVTARDFEFSHEAIVEHLPPESQGAHRFVRSVERVDAKTVRVLLRSRTADWRTLFYRVMPWHALKNQDRKRSGATGSWILGRAHRSGMAPSSSRAGYAGRR